MIHISAEEQAKIKSLAKHLSHLGCDRVDSEKLLEQAWRSGATYCHRCPEAEVQKTQMPDNLAEIERETILRVYAECGENFKESCARLGIGKTTLFRKLKEYGFQRKHIRSLATSHSCPRCGYKYNAPEAPKAMAAASCQ